MEEVLKQVVSELQLLRGDVGTIKQDVSGLKQDVAELKQDVAELKQDVSALKQDVSTLQQGQMRLEQDVISLKQGQERLEQDVTTLKQGQERLQKDLSEVKELGDATCRQVGMLTEFRTEMTAFRTETNERLSHITHALLGQGRTIERLAVRSINQEAEIVELRLTK